MKSKLKSWTLWVNFAGAVALAFLQYFGTVDDQTATAGYVATVANFLLRFKTSQPII
jgi:hypothetical protein